MRRAQKADARVEAGHRAADWATEYLDAIIAVKAVDGVDGAIAHIASYGSQHTDCIVTDDTATAERFLREVDQRHRAAQRLDPVRRRRRVRHGRARSASPPASCTRAGPSASSSSRRFKYVVRGNGQIRP